MIFVSGKIVITGAKVRDDVYLAFETIYPGTSEVFCLFVIFVTLLSRLLCVIFSLWAFSVAELQKEPLKRFQFPFHSSSCFDDFFLFFRFSSS